MGAGHVRDIHRGVAVHDCQIRCLFREFDDLAEAGKCPCTESTVRRFAETHELWTQCVATRSLPTHVAALGQCPHQPVNRGQWKTRAGSKLGQTLWSAGSGEHVEQIERTFDRLHATQSGRIARDARQVSLRETCRTSINTRQSIQLCTYRSVRRGSGRAPRPVSYTHLRAHETGRNLVCRLLLEKKKKNN